MDCDYDPAENKKLQKELIESSKKKKKRRQSKFSAAVAKEKPVFDPNDKSFEKYIDEYYSLDYEDLIGDLPCRFKYRKVVPNDFGLTVEEILGAPDKELNRWVSVKKIMQRRPEHVELYDVKAYKQKAKDFDKKKKCLPSLYTSENESETMPEANSENMKFNKKMKTKTNIKISEPLISTTSEGKVKGKKKKKFSSEPLLKTFSSRNKGKTKESQNSVYNISESRLKSYGINPKKLKNKLKYKNK